MNHLFASEVICKFVENINNDPREMTEEDWEEIIEYTFNSNEDWYDWSDYCKKYNYMLEEIHTFSVDIGAEIEYWNYNKMINLYMYIVARELVSDCKENIIDAWDCENKNE